MCRYDDWHDISTHPVSSRQSAVVSKTVKEQAAPLLKEGVVGVFCRAYSISEAIEKFLPDVYASSAMEGRFDYIPADSSAGVCVYEDKFAYSHPATDPACEKMMNAFDVVRMGERLGRFIGSYRVNYGGIDIWRKSDIIIDTSEEMLKMKNVEIAYFC